MKAIFFKFLFAGILVAVGVSFAEETETPPAKVSSKTKQSFFVGSDTALKKQFVDLYRKKKLTSPASYPELRRLAAQKIALHCKQQILDVWGTGTDPICAWLEKHTEFLENFLLALDIDHDNIPEALRIVKHLVSHYPKQVEEYPDLAIAIAVVWDKPEAVISNSQGRYQATTPPNQATYEELFLYYTDEKNPNQFRLKTLPWEVLCYVVSHKTSKEERQWAYTTYGNDTKMLGRKYNDVKWINRGPPPLAGKPYTLSNMKQYGGACTEIGTIASKVIDKRLQNPQIHLCSMNS
ncbi:MAG: hypothetical protein FWC43_14065 [Planctomycetaceae bacterium]|nr:hypothetical protein [Planctomycetaceae bacterium]